MILCESTTFSAECRTEYVPAAVEQPWSSDRAPWKSHSKVCREKFRELQLAVDSHAGFLPSQALTATRGCTGNIQWGMDQWCWPVICCKCARLNMPLWWDEFGHTTANYQPCWWYPRYRNWSLYQNSELCRGSPVLKPVTDCLCEYLPFKITEWLAVWLKMYVLYTYLLLGEHLIPWKRGWLQ